MIYESSYDSGRLPYQPDLTRGNWAKPSDFIYAGVSLAFRQDVFSTVWLFFTASGAACVVPYAFCLVLIVVPLFVMQSFLGQFSSSGFISAFRIAPLFKGIGYISLAVNLGILTYYSVFAAIPLLYLIHSLRPTLPWSCEGVKTWSYNFTKLDVKHICHLISNDSKSINNRIWYDGPYQVPSILFLRSRFKHKDLFKYTHSDNVVSGEIVICTLFIWGLIAALFYKWNNMEKLSRCLRYFIATTLTLLCIIVIRFSLLPRFPLNTIYNFFMPSPASLPAASIFIMSAFGAGWGTIIVLASYNKFKTNIIRNSWTICVGQMLTFFSFAFLTFIVNDHFKELSTRGKVTDDIFSIRQHWALYLSTGSVLASMELPNLWCIIFYTMLMLAALVTMITNLLCTLQSIFDEFERFRERKNDVTLIVITLLAICSLYTCTSDGVFYHAIFALDTLVTQTAVNLLLIFVVLWVYGRVRFQRDIEFMLGQKFATWKVYMLRFVSPLFLGILLCVVVIAALMHHIFGSVVSLAAALFFIVLPWLYIPGYMIYILLHTTGTFTTRFKRCCRPMDWYPVELEDRQHYEVSMQNADMTHQLNQLSEATEVE